MIVDLEISHCWHNEDVGCDETYRCETFTIDTSLIPSLIESGSDLEKLHYSFGEMTELLKAIESGNCSLPDGSDKFSLIDTEWEYALVRAPEGSVAERTLYRTVY